LLTADVERRWARQVRGEGAKRSAVNYMELLVCYIYTQVIIGKFRAGSKGEGLQRKVIS
jgi:hypothetical protein